MSSCRRGRREPPRTRTRTRTGASVTMMDSWRTHQRGSRRRRREVEGEEMRYRVSFYHEPVSPVPCLEFAGFTVLYLLHCHCCLYTRMLCPYLSSLDQATPWKVKSRPSQRQAHAYYQIVIIVIKLPSSHSDALAASLSSLLSLVVAWWEWKQSRALVWSGVVFCCVV